MCVYIYTLADCLYTGSLLSSQVKYHSVCELIPKKLIMCYCKHQLAHTLLFHEYIQFNTKGLFFFVFSLGLGPSSVLYNGRFVRWDDVLFYHD